MKRMHRLAVLAGFVLLAAALDARAGTPDVKNFVTHLTGDEEVPARATDAVGQATFKLSDDRSALHYKLIVDGIENVVAAHIHLGAPGANGSVVAFLAGPFSSGGGLMEGVLAEGVITSADLVGPLAGLNLAVLVAALRTDGAYVNVHTNDGVDPANTGPGDFPGGEIRGQIRGAGPAYEGTIEP